ncbi:MAG: hypothetical protein ACYCSI_10695 [Solirubrobacteraceae bacterium]
MVPLVFPLVVFAINTKALEAVTHIAGFPTRDVARFVIALAFMQGAIFAGIACAARLATDIESGFIKRLVLAPVPVTAILAGRLAGVVVTAVMQGTTLLAVLVVKWIKCGHWRSWCLGVTGAGAAL